MPLDPATIEAVVSIGIQLYEFVDKVSKGERGDPLSGIVTQLEAIRNQVSDLGRTIQVMLGELEETLLEDSRIEKLSMLPGAHASVVNYLRTHANHNPENPPVYNDANYVNANTITSFVKEYFRNHDPRMQLAFMGGFIRAMSARIEFITALDICWFQHDPQFISEIREGIDHLKNYISHIKAGIDRQVRVSEKENFHFERPEDGRPIRILDSITFAVTIPGQNLWTSTVQPEDRAATKRIANNVRDQQSVAKQNEVMGVYDQIVAAWNRLVENSASASIQRALLPRTANMPVQVNTEALQITALREIEPAREVQTVRNGKDVTVVQPPRYALPLRDVLLKVLQSSEFQQRQDSALRSSDPRIVHLWFTKAFYREPTADESATLINVMKLFGHKSFFSCLCHSDEYEQRYGEGLPRPEVKDLETINA